MRGAIGWRVIRETASAQGSECCKERPDPSQPSTLPLICFLIAPGALPGNVHAPQNKRKQRKPEKPRWNCFAASEASATIGERAYTGISKTTPEQLDLLPCHEPSRSRRNGGVVLLVG